MKSSEEIKQEVRDYYGKTLKSSEDLKTNACCTFTPMEEDIQNVMDQVPQEVMDSYYGCGICIPKHLRGLRVLDLGSGSGRDCYIVSSLVGSEGHVVGVDMTDEQLDIAQRNVAPFMERFANKVGRLEFIKGDIDRLESIDALPDDSFDLIISNCVVNLLPHKEKLFQNCFRKLKYGGEFYFSDVYCDRRVPENLKNDPVLYGECLGGAMYENDFLRSARSAGFCDPRFVEESDIKATRHEIEKKLQGYHFKSKTYRLMKLRNMDDRCEDYGQAVRFVANGSPSFKLDHSHVFLKNKIEPVCRNTFKMLKETRFSSLFEFFGDESTHFGEFGLCGTGESQTAELGANPGACC